MQSKHRINNKYRAGIINLFVGCVIVMLRYKAVRKVINSSPSECRPTMGSYSCDCGAADANQNHYEIGHNQQGIEQFLSLTWPIQSFVLVFGVGQKLCYCSYLITYPQAANSGEQNRNDRGYIKNYVRFKCNTQSHGTHERSRTSPTIKQSFSYI